MKVVVAQPTPSPEVGDAARHAGLGGHWATFGPVKAKPITLNAVLTGGFGVLAAYFLFHGQVAAFLLGVALVVMGVVGVLQRIRENSASRHTCLALFERGLVVADVKALRVIRYDQTMLRPHVVHHSFRGRPHHSTYQYTLQDQNGQPMVVNAKSGRVTAGFPQPEQWGPAIEHAVTDAHRGTGGGHRIPRVVD